MGNKILCGNSKCQMVLHEGQFNSLPIKCPYCGSELFKVVSEMSAAEEIIEKERKSLQKIADQGILMHYLLASEDQQAFMEEEVNEVA